MKNRFLLGIRPGTCWDGRTGGHVPLLPFLIKGFLDVLDEIRKQNYSITCDNTCCFSLVWLPIFIIIMLVIKSINFSSKFLLPTIVYPLQRSRAMQECNVISDLLKLPDNGNIIVRELHTRECKLGAFLLFLLSSEIRVR